MKYIIDENTDKVEYVSREFWQRFDEVEVARPDGWVLHYVVGGIVHIFDYCQSTGRGDYIDEYREDEYTLPLEFTADAKHNADLMRALNYDNRKAVLVREKADK